MSTVIAPILSLKGLEASYRPTYLYSVAFFNGPVAYFTKASSETTGVTWNGNTYLTSVQQESLSGIGAQSSTGLDIFAQVQVVLGDADCQWWALERQYGFQAATLTVDFVYYDPIRNQFSTDSKRLFVGRCDPATFDASSRRPTTTIRAFAKNSLVNTFVPTVPIQRTCPWAFPSTAAQRAQANNRLSIFWKCGYSPGLTTGNLKPGGGFYTDCPREPQSCKDRGQWDFDSEGHDTHRYGGVQWDPPATFKGKQYTSGKQVQGVNNANPNKWKQVAPLVLGTAWVPGLQTNGVGDPNSTRGEFIIGSSQYITPGASDFFSIVQLAVVNGLLVPRADQTGDLLFRWYKISTGERQGAPNQTAIYNGTGDRYGNLPVIMPIVYQQVASSNSNFSVNVLISKPPIPVYTNASTYSLVRTDSLAWCLLELYRLLSPAVYSQIDIDSVINYDNVHCQEPVFYKDLYGNTSFHARWTCSLDLTTKQPGQQLIESLKIGGGVVVIPTADGTKLRFFGKSVLSRQQPSPVAGSNYNSPIPSYAVTDNPTGTPSTVGYAAFYFNEANIVQGSIKVNQDGINSTPIVLEMEINDQDNDWQQGTVQIGDAIAYDRTGQFVQATLPVAGLPNYDQAYRAGQRFQAERYRGNPRVDSGGTEIITLESTAQTIHLEQGQIVAFSNTQMGYPFGLWRIEGKNPTNEYRRVEFILRWHEDAWYTDQYGQLPSPYTVNYLGSLGQSSVPYPWAPGFVSNVPSDAIYGAGRGGGVYRTFQLTVTADQLFDNSISPQFAVAGFLPINKPVNSLAPRVARQGTVASTGGVIPDGVTLFTYISAIDSAGNEGAVNLLPCVTSVAGAFGNNSVFVGVLSWPAGTTGYRVYSGFSPLTPSFSTSGTGTPSSIGIGGYTEGYAEPPDPVFDHFVLKAKRVLKAGYLVLGPGFSQSIVVANSVTSTTITFHYGLNLNTNQFYTPAVNELAGRIIIAVYQTDGTQVPFLHLRILSNNGFACSIDETMGITNLASLSLGQTWFVVAHQIDGISTSNQTIHFTNNTAGSDTTSLVGSSVRVIAGPGANQEIRTITAGHATLGNITVDQPFSPAITIGSTLVIEESAWAINAPQPAVTNSLATTITTMQAGFDNKSGQIWLVQAIGADKNGTETPANLCQSRLFFWPGKQPKQTIVQGQNLLPNADFSISGSAGEIVAGYYVISNGQNAWRAGTDSTIKYGGARSIWYHFEGAGSGYVVTSTGGLNISTTTTAPIALPEPGATYFVIAHGLCNSNVTTFSTGGVQPIYEFRLTVRYSDGTFDDTGTAGNPFDSANFGMWIENSTYFTVAADKTPVELFVNIGAYIASPDTETVMPLGKYIDVYISSIAFYRVLTLPPP